MSTVPYHQATVYISIYLLDNIALMREYCKDGQKTDDIPSMRVHSTATVKAKLASHQDI